MNLEERDSTASEVGGEGHGCSKMKCHKEKHVKKKQQNLFHNSKQWSIETRRDIESIKIGRNSEK